MRRLVVVAILAGMTVAVACTKERKEEEISPEAQRKNQEQLQTDTQQAIGGRIDYDAQHKLDAIEQKRTGNPNAQSCQKSMTSQAFGAYVDTKGCSPEQLKAEKEAASRAQFDDVMKQGSDTHR